jgi:hypothetical protein
LLCACSGGSGTSVTPAASGSSASTGATMTISIPHAPTASGALRRSPAYISSSTQSVSIDVTPPGSQSSAKGFPMTANLTPTSPGCSSTQSATVCAIQLRLNAGSYVASLTTFDGFSGAGSQLSTGQSIAFTVDAGRVNNVPTITLGGIPTSVKFVASGGQAVVGALVITLPDLATGTLSAYGADADGNLIMGAGAPTLTSVSADNGEVAIVQPTAGAPYAIGLTSSQTNAITHITVTVTPVAGTGTGPVARTVTVQPPTSYLLYVASSSSVRVFDASGTEVTPPAPAFAGLAQGAGASGLAYDPLNGLLYVAVQATPSYILAFDRAGNPQTLNAATQGLAVIGGLTFDSTNELIYAGGENVAFDAGGNSHALNATVPFGYNPTWDSPDDLIVSGAQTLSPNGTLQATLPFTGQVTGVAYNFINHWFYVSTVYPTTVEAYNTSGVLQALSGSFTLNSGTEQIGGITADPTNGNIYIGTNADNTYGFDLNGNTLPSPWHNLSGVGSPTGAAGLALVPP